jgi:hypothetical protein
MPTEPGQDIISALAGLLFDRMNARAFRSHFDPAYIVGGRLIVDTPEGTLHELKATALDPSDEAYRLKEAFDCAPEG